MKSVKAVLATLAGMAWAGSAVATVTLFVNDGSTLSTTLVSGPSGLDSYSGADTFWNVTTAEGTAYPPLSGRGLSPPRSLILRSPQFRQAMMARTPIL
jgi:hypothetical protein